MIKLEFQRRGEASWSLTLQNEQKSYAKRLTFRHWQRYFVRGGAILKRAYVCWQEVDFRLKRRIK
jgi:hypothetical protein